MVLKSMPSVQSSPAQYSAVFPDVVRYAPKRDAMVLSWDGTWTIFANPIARISRVKNTTNAGRGGVR